jgi:hypothetical protein
MLHDKSYLTGVEKELIRKKVEANMALTEREAAHVLGVSPTSLKSWRCSPPKHGGPPYYKYENRPNGKVRYNPKKILQWYEEKYLPQKKKGTR